MTNLSRRDFLRITAIAGGIVAGGGLLGHKLNQALFSLKETRLLMGTVIHLTIISEDEAQAESALQAAFAEMERQIVLFDHRNPGSPLFNLNQAGRLANSPTELVRVFERAREVSEISEGAFDVTVKPLIDARAKSLDLDAALLSMVNYRAVEISSTQIRFGRQGMQATLDGIAKGTVVDGGVAALKAAGCSDVLVEAGGDLMVSGRPISGDGWKIGVTHPRPEKVSGNLAAFTLRSGSAATSGDYFQALTEDRLQHHIVDPRQGLSPIELASVTVLAPDATTADALATAIMVMGVEAGLKMANSLKDVEALAITKDLAVQTTSGFPTLS